LCARRSRRRRRRSPKSARREAPRYDEAWDSIRLEARSRAGAKARRLRETDERDRVVCVSVCARGIERVTDPCVMRRVPFRRYRLRFCARSRTGSTITARLSPSTNPACATRSSFVLKRSTTRVCPPTTTRSMRSSTKRRRRLMIGDARASPTSTRESRLALRRRRARGRFRSSRPTVVRTT